MSAAVEAFRGISWLIVKWMLIATAALVGIGGAVGAVAYAYNWYTHDRHVAEIQIQVSAARDWCPNDKEPILVRIDNRSARDVENSTIWLAARAKGHSTNIVDYGSIDSDFIIKAGKAASSCQPSPKLKNEFHDPRTLEWSIDTKSFRFAP
jgi:hypothetical protein